MKVTVDTANRTLTIRGSFKYADFVAFHQSMPHEWVDYEYRVEPEPVFTHTYPQIPCDNTQLPMLPLLPLFGDPVKG